MAETERSNLPIAEEPEFTTEIPAIRPDDPVHFAQMNAMLESLLGNDVFLRRVANKMLENSLIAHVLDCENPQMVLGADQGPVITGLIDEVKEDVTQLYSEIPKIPQMTPVNVSKGFTSATSFAYTGLSVKIPAKSYYILTFSFGYTVNAPTSVSISNSNAHPSGGSYPQVTGNGGSGLSVTCSGYTETELDLYGWAAYNGQHAQNGSIRGFYLSLPEKQ